VAHSWEYELVQDVFDELQIIESALNDVSSMLRIFHHASKLLNEQNNLYFDCDNVENAMCIDNEIDWENDPIPEWYEHKWS